MKTAIRHITSSRRRQLSMAGLLTLLMTLGATGLTSVDASQRDDLNAMVRQLELGYQGKDGATLEPGAPADLDKYLLIAQLNNNSLRAAFYKFKAAVEKLGYAGAWADPKFSWAYFVENVETRVGPQEQRLSLSQGLKWPGKLDAKNDMALQAAHSAYSRFQAERLSVIYRVKKAYHQFYLLGRQTELTRENVELLRFWESVVRARYTVGLQKHPDLIKAQVELGLLEDRLAGLSDKK
ncbi:MAG: TolC family protein, partial [candidate division Zixibacteria bacterium]|nr:TolC family protein [candidate division Zixibacteria bacterium]